MNALLVGVAGFLVACAHAPAAPMSQYPTLVPSATCDEVSEWPPRARQLGVDGKVVLRVRIDDRGRVLSARLKRGPGYGLDESAREALLRSCSFTPAVDTGGQRVPYEFTYTWSFMEHAAPAAPFVADGKVKRLPEIDSAACAKTVSYPKDAEARGIEGEVRLRVHLDAAGRVESATVVKAAGYGFDEAARDALLNKCRFTAAIGIDGNPVPIDIPYTWTFALPAE